jgi:hypothetical protein
MVAALAPSLEGKGGGARFSPVSGAVGCWLMALTFASEDVTSWLEPFLSTLVFSGLDFDFLSPSRGSSWQRCPIFRLIHRVHGRS